MLNLRRYDWTDRVFWGTTDPSPVRPSMDQSMDLTQSMSWNRSFQVLSFAGHRVEQRLSLSPDLGPSLTIDR